MAPPRAPMRKRRTTQDASPGLQGEGAWSAQLARGPRAGTGASPWLEEKAPGARALLKGPEPEQEGSKAGADPINTHGAARGGQPEQPEGLKRPPKIEPGKMIQI